MIEINLLPHREARRAAEVRETLFALLAGLVAVGLGVFLFDSRIEEKIAERQSRIAQLEKEISQFQAEEKRVAEFKKRKAEVESKLEVIRGLESARSGPVRLFDELATRIPERLWLTHFSVMGGRVELRGTSLDNVVVAEFLRALDQSEYFDHVDLIKTERESPVGGIRLVKFELRVEFAPPAKVVAEAGVTPAGA